MIDRILVPLDGSDVAEQALPHAEALARAFDATIVLARVPEPQLVPVMSAGVWITRTVESEEAHAEAADYLGEIAGRSSLEGLDVETSLPHFPVVQGLLDTVTESAADVVVMTSHGHSGPDRWVFGSVAEKLVQVCPVPIYVVRARRNVPDDVSIRTILVPLDGSKLSERALPAAQTLAQGTNARVILMRVPVVPGYLTVVPETAGWIPEQLRESAVEAETYLDRHADALRQVGVTAEEEVPVVTGGSVAHGVLDEAERSGVDVIVISSHGRSGIGRWLFGSVATRILREATCAVWVVRGDTKDV